MAELVVAGHVCLDLTPVLDRPAALSPGALVEVGPAQLSAGGAVANTGLALHRLGVGVRLLGKLGDDLFGAAVREILEAEGTALSEGMRVVAGETTSYSVVISPPGVDRSFLHCPGANDTFSAGDVGDADLGCRIFHFGYPPLMRRMYADGGVELRSILARARAAGAVTSLDMSLPDPQGPSGRADWAALLTDVLDAVDVFQPSLEELRFMLGAGGGEVDRRQLHDLAGRMLALGPALVAIKLGERGLYVRTSPDAQRIAAFAEPLGLQTRPWTGRELLSPCFEADRVLGTTGSGDATAAGLLAALLRGEEPLTAAASATAVGAASVEGATPTAGIPHWSALAGRLAAGWARRPVAIAAGPGIETAADPLGTIEYRPS
jgi:sugar/nucleoside kinase (ribokinase family)